MSDPRKNFRCEKGHVINDSKRLWGKDSVCTQCIQDGRFELPMKKSESDTLTHVRATVA